MIDLHNFKLIKKEYLKDIGAEGYIYRHSCGARLVFLKNDDAERVFIAAFRTPASNNKGTAHITEHTVLCGSQKYRVKDPFNILDKGSIHSYLNAMTYPDKTVYPVASTNERDFETLVRVYIDAVFKPLIYENEGIFRQEGWNSDGESFNGIVLNEMKGAYSSPESILSKRVESELLKGTGAEYDSGGVPEAITDLSYEEFLNFHKRYYSPSKALLMFYGNVDIDYYAKILDEEYLFGEPEEEKAKKPQLAQDLNDIYAFTPISSKESYLEASYALPQCADSCTASMMCDILAEYLSMELSPLKGELVSSGLCARAYSFFDDASAMPVFTIAASGAKSDSLPMFKQKVNQIWRELAQNGLDEYIKQGVINSYKYYYKAENYGYKPRGLFYLLMLQKTLLYGRESFEPLYINRLFDSMADASFTSFIKNSFLNRGCFGIISDGESKKEEKPVPPKNNESLLAYQAQEDLPEAVNSIKTTDISSIAKKGTPFDFYADESGIYIPREKGDIIYIDILFDTSSLSSERLALLGEYKLMVRDFDEKLSTDIAYYIGDFTVGLNAFSLKGGGFKPCLCFSIGALRENIEKALELLEKVIFCGFNNDSRLRLMLKGQRESVTQSYINGDSTIAREAAEAMTLGDYAFRYYTQGYPLYRLLSSQTDLSAIRHGLGSILGTVIGQKNMYFSVTCTQADKNRVFKAVESFKSRLPQGSDVHTVYEPLACTSLAYAADCDICHNAAAFKYSYRTGANSVVRQILDSTYLWDKIRTEGGAYGGGSGVLRGSCFYIYSYRDPRVAHSYNIFKACGKYLSEASFTATEIDRFKIGAINGADIPIKARECNIRALRRHLKGITQEIADMRREELLSASLDDIHTIGQRLTEAMTNINICSIGNEQKIKNSGLFKEIVRID